LLVLYKKSIGVFAGKLRIKIAFVCIVADDIFTNREDCRIF